VQARNRYLPGGPWARSWPSDFPEQESEILAAHIIAETLPGLIVTGAYRYALTLIPVALANLWPVRAWNPPVQPRGLTGVLMTGLPSGVGRSVCPIRAGRSELQINALTIGPGVPTASRISNHVGPSGEVAHVISSATVSPISTRAAPRRARLTFS
jgi:hypothetical protein